MQIKVISDTHNDHDLCTDLECDVLIHCGDFGTKGNYGEALRFLQWFVKQPAKYKILVPGNHDKRIKSHAELQSLVREYGIHMLMNDSVTINGKLFYGGHFVPFVRQEKYVQDLETRRNAWKDMPDDIDVLVTHAPPKHVLDSNREGYPCGCDELLKHVKDKNIKYHVFGHIHEHGGETLKLWDTTFINAACKNREYLTVRNYQEFYLD